MPSFRHWLQETFRTGSAPHGGSARRRRNATFRPAVERLEERALLAWDLTVSTAATTGVLANNGTFTAVSAGANINVADIQTALTHGTVVVTSNSTGSQAGNIVWNAPFSYTSASATPANLILSTDASATGGNVTFKAMLSDSAVSNHSPLTLTVAAKGAITTQGAIEVKGDVNLKGASILLNCDLDAATIRLIANGDIIESSTNIVTRVSMTPGQSSSKTPPEIAATALSVVDTGGRVILETAGTGVFAAQTTSGSISVASSSSLTIGAVGAATVAADPNGLFTAVSGITTTGGDANIDSSGLAINQSISVGSGTVRLNDSTVTQTSNGTITAARLSVMGISGSSTNNLTSANDVTGPVLVKAAPGSFSFNNTVVAAQTGVIPGAPSAMDPLGFFTGLAVVAGSSGQNMLQVQFTATGMHLRLNGVVLFPGSNLPDNFVYHGAGTTNTVVIVGLNQAQASLAPGQTFLSNQGYNIQVDNSQNIYLYANASSQVSFSGSAGADSFDGLPGYSLMSGSNAGAAYLNEAVGFGQVMATGGAGHDTAAIYGSPGNDTYKVDAGNFLTGPGYAMTVESFQVVSAFLNNGGHDTVTLSSTPGGGGLDAPSNYIYGSANDTANFVNTVGNATFQGFSSYSVMSGSGYMEEAVGFGTALATAAQSGNAAFLYGSTSTNNLTALGNSATLATNPGKVEATGFQQVTATAGSGTNNEHVGVVTFAYTKIGTWTDV